MQPKLLTVNVYTPAFVLDTFVIVGLCKVDVKLFGPVQLQLVPFVAPPVNVNVLPEHIGFIDAVAVTTVGTLFTVKAEVLTDVADPHTLLAVNV